MKILMNLFRPKQKEEQFREKMEEITEDNVQNYISEIKNKNIHKEKGVKKTRS